MQFDLTIDHAPNSFDQAPRFVVSLPDADDVIDLHSRGYGEGRLAYDLIPSVEFGDGFLDDDGNEVEGMPTMTSRVDISDIGGATRMVVTTTFPSLEAMEQLIEMGAEEGMKLALGQVDALLAEAA